MIAKKKYARIAGMNLLILLGLLCIFEIVLRFFGLNYGSCPLNRDPTLHHVHPKNYSYLSYDIQGEFGGFNVIFDSYGRRVSQHESKEDRPEFWFFGDSYTVACQVSWQDSYVGRLENLLDGKFRTVNYGVSGYSPMMYYTLLKQELQNNQPDIVFIQLCENDPSDEEDFEQKARFNDQDEPLFIDGGQTSQIMQLARHSYLAKAIRRAQLTVDYKIRTRRRDRLRSAWKGVNHTIGDDQSVFSSDSRFVKSIGQISTLLDSLNIEHYFFFIPPKETVRNGTWDASVLSTKFNELAFKNEIPFIDLDDAFKSEAQARPLFFEEDFHCNRAGHEVLATELAKKIRQ